MAPRGGGTAAVAPPVPRGADTRKRGELSRAATRLPDQLGRWRWVGGGWGEKEWEDTRNWKKGLEEQSQDEGKRRQEEGREGDAQKNYLLQCGCSLRAAWRCHLICARASPPLHHLLPPHTTYNHMPHFHTCFCLSTLFPPLLLSLPFISLTLSRSHSKLTSTPQAPLPHCLHASYISPPIRSTYSPPSHSTSHPPHEHRATCRGCHAPLPPLPLPLFPRQ